MVSSLKSNVVSFWRTFDGPPAAANPQPSEQVDIDVQPNATTVHIPPETPIVVQPAPCVDPVELTTANGGPLGPSESTTWITLPSSSITLSEDNVPIPKFPDDAAASIDPTVQEQTVLLASAKVTNSASAHATSNDDPTLAMQKNAGNPSEHDDF